MSIAQMRQRLMDKYGQSIKISQMPDKQIASMYQRVLSSGGFNKKN